MPHRHRVGFMKDEKLKIAMLSVHSCPLGQPGGRDTGGMNVYIKELSRELGAMGHCIDIYTRAHDLRDPQVEDLASNVRLIHIKAGRVEDMAKLTQYSHLDDFINNLEAFKEKHQLQYDLIHSHYWLSGRVGQSLGRRWGVPNIVMFHTLGAVKNNLGIGRSEPPLRLKKEKEVADGSSYIIVATEQEKKDLVNYYGVAQEKISVVPCGVNLKLFKSINRNGARKSLKLNGHQVVLFIGRIEPLKGIDKLMEALAILGEYENKKLIILGGDDFSNKEVRRLKKLARALAIDKSVIFHGSVRQEELPLFYSCADVCVIPSYYETFGLVTLESLACGTPVVATDVGAAACVIENGHNGYLVKQNNPDDLAVKIDQVLSHTGGNFKNKKSIRKSVEHYNWTNIARSMFEKYHKVVKSYRCVSPLK